MAVTVQEVMNLVGDYTSASTGNVDTEQQIRQINQAIAYLQRKGGLPSDEKIQSFYFTDDQFFYSCATDFMEEIKLLYNNPDYNTKDKEWEFRDYQNLMGQTGEAPNRLLWSITTVNGLKQVMLLGSNINSGTLIEEFDQVGDWVASGDASGLTRDALQKKVGDASLSFDITSSSGLATLTDATVSLDVKSLFENHGYFKLWVWMSSIAVDGWILKLYVDNSNYWTITETDFDDAAAFSTGLNAWKKIGFPMDNAVKTGTPTIDQTITKMVIQVDLGAGLTSAVDFRVDHLFTAIPDYMDLIYRSSYKGKNATGTSLTTLTDVTDTIMVGDFFADFDDLIARRAALNLWPALRGDKEFYAMYKEEFKEFLRDAYMRFPRRRTNKYPVTRLRR